MPALQANDLPGAQKAAAVAAAALSELTPTKAMRAGTRRVCLCGNVLARSADDDLYCSTRCARADAMHALLGPLIEVEDEADVPLADGAAADASDDDNDEDQDQDDDEGAHFRHNSMRSPLCPPKQLVKLAARPTPPRSASSRKANPSSPVSPSRRASSSSSSSSSSPSSSSPSSRKAGRTISQAFPGLRLEFEADEDREAYVDMGLRRRIGHASHYRRCHALLPPVQLGEGQAVEEEEEEGDDQDGERGHERLCSSLDAPPGEHRRTGSLESETSSTRSSSTYLTPAVSLSSLQADDDRRGEAARQHREDRVDDDPLLAAAGVDVASPPPPPTPRAPMLSARELVLRDELAALDEQLCRTLREVDMAAALNGEFEEYEDEYAYEDEDERDDRVYLAQHHHRFGRASLLVGGHADGTTYALDAMATLGGDAARTATTTRGAWRFESPVGFDGDVLLAPASSHGGAASTWPRQPWIEWHHDAVVSAPSDAATPPHTDTISASSSTDAHADADARARAACNLLGLDLGHIAVGSAKLPSAPRFASSPNLPAAASPKSPPPKASWATTVAAAGRGGAVVSPRSSSRRGGGGRRDRGGEDDPQRTSGVVGRGSTGATTTRGGSKSVGFVLPTATGCGGGATATATAAALVSTAARPSLSHSVSSSSLRSCFEDDDEDDDDGVHDAVDKGQGQGRRRGGANKKVTASSRVLRRGASCPRLRLGLRKARSEASFAAGVAPSTTNAQATAIVAWSSSSSCSFDGPTTSSSSSSSSSSRDSSSNADGGRDASFAALPLPVREALASRHAKPLLRRVDRALKLHWARIVSHSAGPA